MFLRAAAALLGAPLSSPPSPSPPSGAQPADAIVILGAPIRADGTLSEVAAERVELGVALWRRGLAPVICITGGHSPWALRRTAIEAEGMARWVRAQGVPESALRVDREAASTADNAARAAELLLPEGRRRVWLVTQPFHLRRAGLLFRRAGFEPLGWHDAGSVQYREPRLALRWILREYGAWGLLAARSVRASLRRR